MNAQLPQWLDMATEAALKGGEILLKYWGNLSEIKEKEIPGDLVTEADQQSERVILTHISKAFPDHQILAEESGLHEKNSPYLWAIDPLDGTTNYAHRYPMAAVSIGLIANNTPILGVVYNPMTGELYQAAKDHGALLNHQPIRVSNTAKLSHSLLATGFAYDRLTNPDTNYPEFCHFTNITQGVRRAGAASLDLAYVACGRLDAYWERGLKLWDIAAGAILVQEAGGTVTDYDRSPLNLTSGRILASNTLLHAPMSQELLRSGK